MTADKLVDVEYKKALEAEKEGKSSKVILKHLEAAAHVGSSEAIYALGSLYLHGKHVQKDEKKALDHFRQAAEQMHSSALFDLATALERGEIVDADKSAAFRYYFLAMLMGDRSSIYEVGRCFYYGIGTQKNKKIYEILMDAHEHLENADRAE